MNKKIIKALIILFLTIGINLLLTNVSNAALSISTSKYTVSPGESFSVTVSVSGDEAGAINLSASNGTLSSSYVDLMTQSSVTVSCTAGNAGTVSIYASGKVANYSTETEVQQSVSKSVTVQEPVQSSNNTSGSSGNSSSTSGNTSTTTTNSRPSTSSTNTTAKPEEVKKSSDATLKSLVIEGQELYPEFSTTVNEYNVKVANDITSIKISPTVNDSKAKYALDGVYENLEVGENTASVVVTAEDGSTMRYVIRINRARENLSLGTLKISYINELGEIVDITPEIEEELYEYSLNDLPYYVSRLDFEVISNLKEAQIEILGNEELQEGENIITITITMPSESEEVEDEVLTYKFTVNKEAEPKATLIGKIQKWFKGITGTIGTWFNQNKFLIVVGALVLCSITLGGLVVYLIFDYKKYKKLLEKVAQITKMNAENAVEGELNAIPETTDNIEIKENIVDEKVKQKGRHF